MRVFHGPSDELWPDRYEFDLDELRSSDSHDDFMTHAVELFKEVGIITALVASTTREDIPAHDRNEAIRRGLIVRMAKLANSLLNETCAGHGEQQLAITRQVLETAMNIIYLLGGGDESYDAFVFDSLIAERDLADVIRTNIEARGGEALPIEKRMLGSIAATAAGAGVDLDSIPSKSKNNWPSAVIRLQDLGLEDLYVVFRLGSTAIHGGWSDIYLHHLDDKGDARFAPHFDHVVPRPEPLTAMGMLTTVAASEYIQTQGEDIVTLFEPRLADLRTRIEAFDQVHEEYLQRQGKR